jgi:hypothetical protein
MLNAALEDSEVFWIRHDGSLDGASLPRHVARVQSIPARNSATGRIRTGSV